MTSVLKLCGRSPTQTLVLYVPTSQHKFLVDFSWEAIIWQRTAPQMSWISCVLLYIITNPKLKNKLGPQVIPLCTAYSILMYVMCRELFLFQRVNAVLLRVINATKRVNILNFTCCNLL